MSRSAATERHLRIGEVSRRCGVSSERLRAWERRYELFAPERTGAGYRLYGHDDVLRVERMLGHLDGGLSAAQAAALTVSEFAGDPVSEPLTAEVPQMLGEELERALDRLDDAAAHGVLDRLFARFATDTVVREVVLPCMRGLGDRWERGQEVIAAEHFASALLRGRLLALARGWGGGGGPHALLACMPGEQHDIGLICFGLALRGRGWRITFLGADTPRDTLHRASELLDPTLVVLAACMSEAAEAAADRLGEIAARRPLAIGGAGTSASLAARAGARHLAGDPLDAAAEVSAR